VLQNNIIVLFFIIFVLLIYTIMAVATSMAIIGGLGLAKGIYDTVSASSDKKKRQAELDAFQRQDLTNSYENMQISTIGSDVMREESSRNMATSMNTIGNAGTRAIIGATPKLVAERNNVGREIQKNLDDQVQKRNYAIAVDDGRIRDMQEQRDNADLAGLGNAINVANQDMNTGMNTALNGVMAGASSMTGTIGKKPPTTDVNAISNNSFDYSKYSNAHKLSFAPLPTSSSVNNNEHFSRFRGFQKIGYPEQIDFTPKPYTL
jgi:hypothetical protein